MRIFKLEESALIAIYRKEIDSNDHFHKALALMLGLLVIGLGVAYDLTDRIQLLYASPALTISMLGAIIRLDTIVHRLGWLLYELDDPWELKRGDLLHDKKFLTFSDVLAVLPVLFYLVRAYMALLASEMTVLGTFFIVSSMIVILAAVVIWGLTPSFVRREK